MKRTIEQHEAAIIKVIKANDVKFFSHIFIWYKGIGRAQAYNLGLDKLDGIKKALWENRQAKISDMISEMANSDNPTLKIAALRMLADPDQREALNTVTKVDAKVSTPDSGIAIKFLKDDSDKPE